MIPQKNKQSPISLKNCVVPNQTQKVQRKDPMRFMQIVLALINIETLIIKTDMQPANDITDKNNVPVEKIKKGISKFK